MELRQRALEVLAIDDPATKAEAVAQAWASIEAGECTLDGVAVLVPAGPLPGRPALPRLVPPQQVPRRTPFSIEGRAALMHAVAHIEFNAINLALDAVWRFAGLPAAYYLDWWRVAAEEATHFGLVREHLRALGHDYGEFDAHDGLWSMTEKTAGDPIARMALVPRTLEARGLDATPPMQKKLAHAGDARAVAILDVILHDEVGHVAVGNHWYRWLCGRAGLDPVAHYAVLARQHGAPRLKGPFNLDARARAGFTADELAALDTTGTPR